MNKEKTYQTNGFTLVELLIGVTISVLIFLGTSSILALLFSSDLKSQRIESLEQSKNDIVQEISNGIRWGETINWNNDSLRIDQVEYRVQDKRLYKNSEPITSQRVSVEDMSITNLSNSSELKSLLIEISLSHAQYNLQNEVFRFTVSQRKTTYE